MPYKNIAERRAKHAKYMREKWYPANKAKHMALVHKRTEKKRAEAAALLDKIRTERGCIDCGNKDRRVLEFDHVRGEKSFEIARGVSLGVTAARLLEEIAKCEVRCANCHRISTVERREGVLGWRTKKKTAESV